MRDGLIPAEDMDFGQAIDEIREDADRMEVYLDHAATTRCYDEVIEAVTGAMREDFGNPSSMHRKGVEAEAHIRQARESLARILRVQPREIYFTSGGTESNNWAIMGAARAGRRRGRHIITSSIEHPAVSAPLAELEKEGWRITRLSADREGRVDLEELERALCRETVLVSVMHVNNEIGTVEPIEEIGRLVKERNPSALFHVDAIQSFGKLPVHPRAWKADLVSVSGHKIHGPKGIGFLYLSEKVRIPAMIWGGGQQNGLRSGTDNVPGIAGLGLAAELFTSAMEEGRERMYVCKERLAEGLLALPDVRLHGPADLREGVPHILQASFLGVRSEVLLHTLEERGIYISAGSACSSHKRAGSPTLTAIGCSREEMESAVRFSFCEQTTEEEIDYTLEVIREVLPSLRIFVRR